MKKLIILLSALFFTMSIVMAQGKQELEPLYAVSFTKNHITVKVNSNGCTTKENFLIEQESVSNSHQIRIIKIKKDRCRARRRAITIELPFATDFAANKPRKRYRLVNEFIVE